MIATTILCTLLWGCVPVTDCAAALAALDARLIEIAECKDAELPGPAGDAAPLASPIPTPKPKGTKP